MISTVTLKVAKIDTTITVVEMDTTEMLQVDWIMRTETMNLIRNGQKLRWFDGSEHQLEGREYLTSDEYV
jgi:hypothetical protein